jgi:hypothetical protein
MDERVFNYSIKGQEGRRFWGVIESGSRTEPLAGAISLDGKTGMEPTPTVLSTSASVRPTR